MLLNIGLYGAPGPKTRLGIVNNNSGPEYTEAFVAANRALEGKVRECGGCKWWTGPVFASEGEFWEGLEQGKVDTGGEFDFGGGGGLGGGGTAAGGGTTGGREGYAALRARCGAEGLPWLYETCSRVGAGVGSSDTQGRDSISMSSGSATSSSRPSTAMSSRPSTAMSGRPSMVNMSASGRPSINSLRPIREVLMAAKVDRERERASMGSVGLPTGRHSRTASLRNVFARKRETV